MNLSDKKTTHEFAAFAYEHLTLDVPQKNQENLTRRLGVSAGTRRQIKGSSIGEAPPLFDAPGEQPCRQLNACNNGEGVSRARTSSCPRPSTHVATRTEPPEPDGGCRDICLFPPFRDARGALSVILTSPLPLPPQFSIDELRRQMDKKHNIRNMSVIAHVDHVSAPTERRARVSGVDCAGVSIALSEPPSTGFGLAGGENDARGVRVEDACRRPGRLGRVAGGAGDEADASRPSSRPPPPPPRAPPDANCPLVGHPSVRRCRARRSRFGKCAVRRVFSFHDRRRKKKQRTRR